MNVTSVAKSKSAFRSEASHTFCRCQRHRLWSRARVTPAIALLATLVTLGRSVPASDPPVQTSLPTGAASQAVSAPQQVPPPKQVQDGRERAPLPAGTVLWLRLETLVSTKSSHLREPVTARVVRDVKEADGIAVPLGATARGRIEKLIPSSSADDRARLLIRFTKLEIAGQPPLALDGHIREVENARETVLPDGTIRGLLAGEVPISRLEGALEKLSKSNPAVAEEIRKTQKQTLGQSDTSIDYPAGTDLALVLDQPLLVGQRFAPAVPEALSKPASATLEALLPQAPLRAESKDGQPGDPLNLVVIGKADEIRQAFEQAGWSEAESKNEKSVWRTVRAIAGDIGYGSAPVSQLYLYGRPEDVAFEKGLNTFAKRHHLRLWRSPKTTADGREIWLGAATHDTGIDVHPGVVSHAIDPDLDAERAKVGADLAVTGRVAAEQLVTRPAPLSEGQTATGAKWKTDGRLLGIELGNSTSSLGEARVARP